MHYLIQTNIYTDPQHKLTIDVLRDLGYSFETIYLDAQAKDFEIESDRNDVFVYGSVKLARLAKENKNWTPGSFYGGNHKYENHAKYYGKNMINSPIELFKLGERISWGTDEGKFIKPYKNAKLFTGKVFSKLKWEDFSKQLLTSNQTEIINASTLVQVSKPKKIIKEARLWIIGNEIIASVYYKFHGDQPFESMVSQDGIEFAKEMLNLCAVAPAFVMDIGFTTEGWKIIEVNCINSAGFYHLDSTPVFRALEQYFTGGE
ncbi:MAG: ATP-grasp domain-containing protein [Flavobacteriales bacterium]